jgi:hypothetical protein
MIRFFVMLAFVALTFAACSKKQDQGGPKYTAEEFMALAHEAKVSDDKTDPIKFSDYSPGVTPVESKALKYQRLIFFAIAFNSVEDARNEARRLNQYYSRNWLFDRVEGEPILEDYLITTFKAENPNRKIQRTPKVPAHGEGHGEGHGESAPPAHH